MAEILKTNQEKYVPCSSSGKGKKNILTKIPFHGDQLFEERARNVQMTFQDGINPYERLEGLSTEAADWHAKVNLYSVSEKITGSMITYPTMMPKRLNCMESHLTFNQIGIMQSCTNMLGSASLVEMLGGIMFLKFHP